MEGCAPQPLWSHSDSLTFFVHRSLPILLFAAHRNLENEDRRDDFKSCCINNLPYAVVRQSAVRQTAVFSY